MLTKLSDRQLKAQAYDVAERKRINARRQKPTRKNNPKGRNARWQMAYHPEHTVTVDERGRNVSITTWVNNGSTA